MNYFSWLHLKEDTSQYTLSKVIWNCLLRSSLGRFLNFTTILILSSSPPAVLSADYDLPRHMIWNLFFCDRAVSHEYTWVNPPHLYSAYFSCINVIGQLWSYVTTATKWHQWRHAPLLTRCDVISRFDQMWRHARFWPDVNWFIAYRILYYRIEFCLKSYIKIRILFYLILC